MSGSYNIPTVTAGAAVEQLSELYITAIQSGCLPRIPSVALWGPMGVGKSSAVHAIAARISSAIGQPVEVTDIRLLNFSPVDLRGVPAADDAHAFTVWLKPKLFDLAPDRYHILFLDEISAAPQSMQAAAYQIALDKRIGEFPLPETCIVICAGNRTTDKSVAFRMPKALANRLMHFEIAAAFDSWYRWAVQNGIHEAVLGYLSFDQSKLISEDLGMEELAFPTPRSWEFVSRLLQTTGKAPEEIHPLLAGCVGVSTALEFEAWCRVYRKLPSTEKIFSGRCSSYPREMDALYALISSMIARVTRSGEQLSGQELENACRYAARFPADFAAMFYRSLLNLEGMNLRLMKCPSFVQWMKANKKYL